MDCLFCLLLCLWVRLLSGLGCVRYALVWLGWVLLCLYVCLLFTVWFGLLVCLTYVWVLVGFMWIFVRGFITL